MNILKSLLKILLVFPIVLGLSGCQPSIAQQEENNIPPIFMGFGEPGEFVISAGISRNEWVRVDENTNLWRGPLLTFNVSNPLGDIPNYRVLGIVRDQNLRYWLVPINPRFRREIGHRGNTISVYLSSQTQPGDLTFRFQHTLSAEDVPDFSRFERQHFSLDGREPSAIRFNADENPFGILLDFGDTPAPEEQQQQQGRILQYYTQLEEIITNTFPGTVTIRSRSYPNGRQPFSKETIDSPIPGIQPDPNDDPKTLFSNLCAQHTLDGILFGHLEEDALNNALIFQVRLYVRQDGNYDITNETTLPIQNGMTQLLADNINSAVQELLRKPFFSQGGRIIGILPFSKIVSQQVRAVLDGQTNRPPEQGETRITPPQTPPGNLKQPVTIQSIYEMLIKREFYCKPNEGDLHEPALQNLQNVYGTSIRDLLSQRVWQVEMSDEFKRFEEKLGGLVSSDINYIKVVVKRRDGTGSEQVFHVHPFPKKKNYKDAQAFVADLNRQQYGGFNDWEIPTIEELFAIFQYESSEKNEKKIHFPSKWFVPPQRTSNFWSSTPLSSNGTVKPTGPAHFILKPDLKGEHFTVKFNFGYDSRSGAAILAIRKPLKGIQD